MPRISWFTAGALVFALWAAANTAVTLWRYGWDQGMYLWFCNLCLWAAAWGLWRRDRSLLLAFLGVAVLTQPWYVLDGLTHLVSGEGWLEVAEFLYQPGMGLGEFALTRYHYFLIPVMAAAVYHLPRGRDLTGRYILAFNVLIFGLSYFAFSGTENVNCIHEPCIDSWKRWVGPWYPPAFFLLILSGNFVACRAIDRGLERLGRRADGGRWVTSFLGIGVGLGVVFSGLDVGYKSRLPRFRCAGPFEDSGVRVSCLYTLEYDTRLMELAYEIENKLDVAQQCDTRINFYGTEYENVHERLYLRPREKMKLTALLAYPDRDVRMQVAAACLRFH